MKGGWALSLTSQRGLLIDDVDCKVISGHSDIHAGLCQPVRVRKRVAHVALPCLPMFEHRGAGELVVLGLALVMFLPVDEMDDVDGGRVASSHQMVHVGII